MSREIFENSSIARGAAQMLALRRPAAVGEEKLQPHDGSKGLPLLTVDHPGKATKTALETPHVDALVGRPLVFRHDASPVKAHVSRGGDLVGGQVQAEQRYCHFKRSAILRPARRTRVHKTTTQCRKNRGGRRSWVATIRRLCRNGTTSSIRYSLDSGLGLYRRVRLHRLARRLSPCKKGYFPALKSKTPRLDRGATFYKNKCITLLPFVK